MNQPIDNMTCPTAAILAGGESRRMGRPKEGVLLPAGRPMIAHIIAVLRSVCPRVVVVGACVGYQLPDDIIHLHDLHPGAGPLAGLETLLASGLDDRYLLVGCDQPLLTPDLLRRLACRDADAVCLFHTGDPDNFFPFPGVYSAGLLPLVRESLQSGERSMKRLLARVAVTHVPLSPTEASRLRSINTPNDLAQLHAAGKGHGKTGTIS